MQHSIALSADPAARRPVKADRPSIGLAHRVAKDGEIFAEGDDASFFYKVIAGAVRTSRSLVDGRRQIDGFHFPGDIFGLESGQKHRSTAEAIGPVAFVAIRRCSLEELARTEGSLARQVVASLMQSLERSHDHVLLLGRKCAIEKIATFLLDLSRRLGADGGFELPMSRTDIADHLGLTIETVSRSLMHLERIGMIHLRAGCRAVQLQDRRALLRMSA